MRSKKSILVLAVMIISLTPAKAQNGSASTWLEVSTEHFTFVYQTEDRNGADTLVLIAEAVYDRVAAFYDSYPKHVVCVLRSDTAFANGHFSPLPPHIEIVTSAPSGPLIGAATESWIEAVFIHELGHYIHLNARDGMFGLLSTLFGPMPATLTAGFMPGWMVEGPSVFLETLLTGGGRGRNAFFEMYSRALLLEDRFFSLKRAAHSSRLPPPGRIYVAGYLLVEYLSANFGDEIFGRIAKRFARFPLFGPWRAIRQETGLSADEIFERMIDSRLEIYRRTRPVGTGTRITPDSVGDYYLPVSTDAGWILYRNQPRESRGIVHLSRGSGAITPIVDTSLTDPYSLTAERNGNRIAFAAPVSTVNDAGTQIGSSLFLHDRRSGSTTRLTDLGALRHPALSPDGSRLFAVRQEKEFASLIEVDMGTGAQSLVLRIAGTNLFTPFVSDDSASVLFVTNIRGKQDIAQIDIDLPRFPMVRDMGDAWNADRITYLTDTVAAEYYPRQSGNYLVYGSDANGLLELYQLDLRSGVISLLVTDPVGAFAGFIDEASIIYASYSHTGWIVKRSEYDPKAIIRGAAASAAASAAANAATRTPARAPTKVQNGP